MPITEDDRQAAWVALLERGGPSSVRNTRTWLVGAARIEMRRRMVAEFRQREAAFYAATGSHSVAWLERQARLTEYQRARRRAAGIPEKRKGRDPEKAKARQRRYNAKRVTTPQRRAQQAEWIRRKRAARRGVCNDVRSDGRTNGGDGS